MRNKKLVSLIAVAALVLANSVNVFAAQTKATVENVDTGYTASTDVTATVTAEMLGEDVVVTVPSKIELGASNEIDLTSSDDYYGYDGTTWAAMFGATAGKDHIYAKGAQITAKGVMPDGNRLFIAIVPQAGSLTEYLKLTKTDNASISVSAGPFTNSGAVNDTYETDNAGNKRRAKYYSLDKATVQASHVADDMFIPYITSQDMQSIGTYTGTLNYFVAVCADENAFKAALVAPYNI